jgi:hypothetical protein
MTDVTMLMLLPGVRCLKNREEPVLNTVKVEQFTHIAQCQLASILLVRTNSRLLFLVFVTTLSTLYVAAMFCPP